MEETTIESFSSDNSVEVYTKTSLNDIERYLINKYFKKTDNILDLGCGVGRTTVALSRLGYKRLIGIDIVDKMIKKALVLYPGIKFLTGDASNLDFPNSSFDIVFFSFNGIDCIHPEKKLLDTIKEIRRILRPNGLYIFCSHNSMAIPKDIHLLKLFIQNVLRGRILFGDSYRYENHPFGDIYLYHSSQWKWKRNLEQLGFEVVEIVGNPFFRYNAHYVCRKVD